MKRSSKVCLLVLSTSTVLGGCGKADVMQDTYASRIFCERDWGEAQLCTGFHLTSEALGPRYFWSGEKRALVVESPEHSVRVTPANSLFSSSSSVRSVAIAHGAASAELPDEAVNDMRSFLQARGSSAVRDTLIVGTIDHFGFDGSELLGAWGPND